MARMLCSPSTEVIGQAMLSYIDNLQAEVMRPLMEKYHLVDIQRDQWYPLLPWLHCINELAHLPSFSSNMVAVGLKVVEYAVTPPEMQDATLAQMLEGWNIHFHANHRNGDVGQITTIKIDDTHYKTIHEHIYPDDMNYGLAFGFARTLLPKDARFTVWYEDPIYRLDYGGADKTVIHVKWE